MAKRIKETIKYIDSSTNSPSRWLPLKYLGSWENILGWTQIFTLLAVVATAAFTAWLAFLQNHANQTIEDTGQKQLRAYLHVTPRLICISGDPMFETSIDYDVVNDGATPAHNVQVDAHLCIVPYPVPIVWKFSNNNITGGGNYIGSHSTISLTALLGRSLSPNEPHDLTVDEIRFCLIGVIHYKDIFNKDHHLRFCATEQGGEASKLFVEALNQGHHYALGKASCDYDVDNNFEY